MVKHLLNFPLAQFRRVALVKQVLNESHRLDRAFHALADPTRRGMVARLSRAPASVSELARPLRMSLPAVMQHLRLLEASGLVTSEKKGRVRTCRIEPKALEAAESWIAGQRELWEARLDRFEAYVDVLKDVEMLKDRENRNG
jgi:DNA-binding transcriptional ArsR family regulator